MYIQIPVIAALNQREAQLYFNEKKNASCQISFFNDFTESIFTVDLERSQGNENKQSDSEMYLPSSLLDWL